MGGLLQQASTYAAEVDRVIWVVALLGGFWLLLSELVLFYFMWRFRRKRSPKARYMSGESHGEMAWIHWPHNLVIICDVVIVAFAMSAWYNIKQTLPPADATVRIVGQQWAWKFVHPGSNGELGTPEDVEIIDELHLQVNKTYHFKLESKDVLHSFSVPVFRLKQDAVPGRVITGWFTPTSEGEFDIQCAEICGIGHGIMVAKLIVQNEDDYAQWIAAQRLRQKEQGKG